MESNLTRRWGTWRPVLVISLFLACGLALIYDSVRSHDLWSTTAGIFYFLLALSYYLASRGADQLGGQTSRRRASTIVAVMGMLLILAKVLLPGTRLDPFAWYAGHAPVSPARLVHYPILYNDRKVHTAGTISVNARGWCVLDVNGAPSTGSPHAQSGATGIVLVAKGLKCEDSGIAHHLARVSGIFHAYVSSDRDDMPFALTSVRIAGTHAPGKAATL